MITLELFPSGKKPNNIHNQKLPAIFQSLSECYLGLGFHSLDSGTKCTLLLNDLPLEIHFHHALPLWFGPQFRVRLFASASLPQL